MRLVESTQNMQSVLLRCLVAIGVIGIWLPVATAQPPSPAAFKAFAAGRRFVDTVGAINPFLPDAVRHEKITQAIKELRNGYPSGTK